MSDPRYLDLFDPAGLRARDAARQVLETTRPFRTRPDADLEVLDVGCGYAHTAAALAWTCRQVVGLEPSAILYNAAVEANGTVPNLELRHCGIESLIERDRYDVAVLDNVLEHLPDHRLALEAIARALRPGGVLYLLVPNRLWPLEPHYRLPFLSYLPLRAANAYLRLTKRGEDFTDASYAPTYGGLNRLFRERPELEHHYVLPADLSLAEGGGAWHYRVGAQLIRRVPALWRISKALLVVAVKRGGAAAATASR
ncbi:MAG TPA: class I SAM-dependent methyltransferase [Thermoanaerobaculia bacterium]